jgi:phosphoglycerate dehydrogenase-like enzyme
MKAVLHHRVSDTVAARFSFAAPAWLDVVPVSQRDESRLQIELADAEVLLHVLEPVDATTLAKAPALQLIQKLGVGVNTIDRRAAAIRGIRVCNMPDVNSQAVVEATLALILGTLRKLVVLDVATRGGEGWALPIDCTDDVQEICGKTVGFVGYGAIPQRLAPVLKALGARLLCFSRNGLPDGISEPVSFRQLLAESDILSLHLPLTAQTRQMVSAHAIAAMKPGAILINTARGELVDEAALAHALASGKLRGAGLDVFANEPLPPSSPLRRLSNVVLTPHTAWLTAETLDRCLLLAIENCTRLRDGLPLLNEIAPDHV